ncbi:hypothetical protein L1987_03361 [Smallanthus sonchifolius]|uniref:Uncharacterized protein n=1 Tax=Smallanthus sonchifolius TaxID=185202 RepID=A0ACB9KAH5_9ASTR|nr:hypothetical protein L1987_03361 [Smallanthus sonchifolius]
MMHDFKVETINDSEKEFFVYLNGPSDSPYAGGVWKVRVELPDEASGTVCLDVINQTWSPMFDLVNVFEAFLPQLLLDPNAADPLNADAAALLLSDKATYEARVKEYCERYAKPEDVGAVEEEKPSDEEEEASEDGKDSASGDEATTSGPVDPLSLLPAIPGFLYLFTPLHHTIIYIIPFNHLPVTGVYFRSLYLKHATMADKEEGKETDPRGADWEVVSLTASTYAAAPGPDMEDPESGEKSDLVGTDKSETSNALFMSGHFVFPPSQHENLPLEPENTEILGEQGGEDYVSESIKEKRGKSFAKDEDNWNVKKLTESDDFHGIPFFDDKGNRLTINDVDFGDSKTLPGLNLAGKEENIYSSAKFHSFRSEPIMGESNIDDDDRVLSESIESSGSSSGSNAPNLPKHTEEDNYDGSGLPYAAWWKKQAAALYAHAKEANTFWSIFIAAAVMGLVIIGQQWQQERWQVLHHRWHSGVYDEKFGRMVGPISRFKDAIVGGNRQGFSIRSRDQ